MPEAPQAGELVQPLGEISEFRAKELEESLKTRGYVKIPEGTVANLRVAVRDPDSNGIDYHSVGKASVKKEVLAILVRTTNIGVEQPDKATAELKVVSEAYLAGLDLLREKEEQLAELVTEEMKKRNLDPHTTNGHIIVDIVIRVAEQNPQLASEISELTQKLSLEEEEIARETLTVIEPEKQLSDIGIDPNSVIGVSLVVAMDEKI